MTFTTPLHTNEQSVERVLHAGLPVLLTFWRKDCAPCQQLDVALGNLARAYAGKLLIAKIDVQENVGLARRYNISQLPELVYLTESSEVSRAQGAAGEAALRSWLDDLLSGGRPTSPRGPSVALNGASTAGSSSGGAAANGHATRPAQASSSAPVTLTDATFDQVVGGGDMPILVDFWASWCGPCRAVAPTVERLAEEFAGRAVVAKLNVDENPRIAQRFGITGIPALYVFKRGRIVERLAGAQPAPVLRQALTRHLGG